MRPICQLKTKNRFHWIIQDEKGLRGYTHVPSQAEVTLLPEVLYFDDIDSCKCSCNMLAKADSLPSNAVSKNAQYACTSGIAKKNMVRKKVNRANISDRVNDI